MDPLSTELLDRIRKEGPLAFETFMELALYHPQWGYYSGSEGKSRIGKEGDFMTSVSVGSLYGKLLARQFVAWWKEIGSPRDFDLVECGALDGQLAEDILREIHRTYPDALPSVRYTIMEPLPKLVACQKNRLSAFTNIEWFSSFSESRRFNGIIFGNELLDAFPVQIWERGKEGWTEWRVGEDQGKFVWKSINKTKVLNDIEIISNKYHYEGRLENCPRALGWIAQVFSRLDGGRILLVDYGYTDEEYFQVSRSQGTLRGYDRHRRVSDLLAKPGSQDLTAHVRWSPLIHEAISLGFSVEEFIQQGRWLTRIAAKTVTDWNPKDNRQFQTLTHPESLGTAFRVLVLKK